MLYEVITAFVNSPTVAVKSFGIGAHFTPKGSKYSILQLSSSNLYHMGKFFFLCLKCFLKL